MARAIGKIAPDWWDYVTLDQDVLSDAAKLTPQDMAGLSLSWGEGRVRAQGRNTRGPCVAA